MRLLADLHVSPKTVKFLRDLGHDVVRVNEILSGTASDHAIVARAEADRRAILTQDLDFSAIIALTGKTAPSVITLRLFSSRIEYVNSILERVLPELEQEVRDGVVVTVEDHRARRRRLPIVPP
jgi:predicted nuclease of predicted toxin-antitoxin system